MVVVVLFQAEIHADPVAEAEQQLQLGIVAELDAPLDPDRRPVEGAPQVTLFGEQLGEQVAGARRNRIAVRGKRLEQPVRLGFPAQVSSAVTRCTRGSANVAPPSSIAAENSSAARCGSSALIHCSPAGR